MAVCLPIPSVAPVMTAILWFRSWCHLILSIAGGTDHPGQDLFGEIVRSAQKLVPVTSSEKIGQGDIRDVEVYTGPIDVKGRLLLFCIVHDITERKRAEEALQAPGAEAVAQARPWGVGSAIGSAWKVISSFMHRSQKSPVPVPDGISAHGRC